MDNRVYLDGDISIGISDINTAFDERTIGSKVIDGQWFLDLVVGGIRNFDWSSCRQKGQALIKLSGEACKYVSGGVGKRTQDPDDYIIRVHRGEVGMYLKRQKTRYIMEDGWLMPSGMIQIAAPVDSVSVVIYTKEAYDIDPDITPEEIIRTSNLTHIVVAVLASSGQPSTLTPKRFCWNLSGGNLEAQQWTADEIRAKAKEIKDYCSNWCVVAD